MKVVLGVAKIKHENKRNSLPDLLKLIKFKVVVQKDELHKVLHYFFEL